MRSVFFVAILVLCWAPLSAEVFKWTDSKETQHFTDDPANIPLKYRKKAVPLKGFDDAEAPPVTPKASAPAQVSPKQVERNQQAQANHPPPKQPSSPLDALAATLQEKASTDRDKAFAAFSWVHANIYYDNATKWQRRNGKQGNDQGADGVLAAKRGVCEGMANLFAALATKMGLESVVVTGRASGSRQEAHAWNAVLIDGTWGLVDLTRGSFLRPPQDFLAHHFPDDPRWQLLEKPLTYREWLGR